MSAVRRLDAGDAAQLTALYHDYEWWSERTVTDVRTALAETDVAVGVERDDELVAAARVMTDFVFYAMVYDVIVAAGERGEGFGRRLIEAVVATSELDDVPSVALVCRSGLIPFYRSVGFDLFDTEVPPPEGGDETFVQMTYPSGE